MVTLSNSLTADGATMATTFHHSDASRVGFATDLVCRVHTLDGLTLDKRAVRSMLEQAFERNAHLWVIEQNGVTAGYLLVEFQARGGFLWSEATIGALYLRRDFRGTGLAQKARQLVRDSAPQLGGVLKWRQVYREDAALALPAQPSATMVAA